jgi:hypothetical protein
MATERGELGAATSEAGTETGERGENVFVVESMLAAIQVATRPLVYRHRIRESISTALLHAIQTRIT